jgi:hypothetical protein
MFQRMSRNRSRLTQSLGYDDERSGAKEVRDFGIHEDDKLDEAQLPFG